MKRQRNFFIYVKILCYYVEKLPECQTGTQRDAQRQSNLSETDSQTEVDWYQRSDMCLNA